MKSSTLLTTAALFASSQATLVLLKTTKCLDASIPYNVPFDVTANAGPIAVDNLNSICGLRIVSSTPGININTVQCRAFKDVAGTQPGSAVFTYAQGAQIATNPVAIKAVECTYPIPAQKSKRQDNGTASATPVLSTVTLPVSSNAAGQSTITSTVVVGPSSTPESSANATSSTLSMTATPSSTQSSAPSESSGAAGSVGVGAGVSLGAVAAVMAMFL